MPPAIIRAQYSGDDQTLRQALQQVQGG